MSVAIGFHAGSYVMFAADTRMTFYRSAKDKYFEDHHSKIRRTQLGLIAGVGYARLLDSVKRRLAEEDTINTDEIIRIIREERAALPTHVMQDATVRKSVEHETGWMITYVAGLSHDRPELGPSRLRCAPTHPTEDYTLGLHKIGAACMFPSTQVPPELTKELGDELQRRLKTIEGIDGIADNIAHNTVVCAGAIARVSEVDDSVANRYQIGVHISCEQMPWLVGISDLSVDGLIGDFDFGDSPTPPQPSS